MLKCVKSHRVSKNSLRNILIIVVSLIAGIIGGFSITSITLSNGETITIPKIEFADNQLETNNDLGMNIQAPSIDYVDAEIVTNECPDNSVECAKGSILPEINITTPEDFYRSVIDKCIDFDGAYGSQCYDLMAYFHYVYTGRWLSTNGTGGAYGIWEARDYNNQNNEYELITDTHSLRIGDFAVFHNGIYGHVGMVLGSYNNGYIALLGTNQGGYACTGGGSAANVINMSLTSFSGAFRPRIWIKPDPIITPSGLNVYQTGDTFGQYLLDHNLATPETLWGEDINYYNEQLRKQGILEYRDNHYYNNIPVGTEINLIGK